jgi:hypothetical protein
MFCYQCGKQIVDGARYCHYCGSEQPDFVQEGADLPQMNPAPVQSQVGPAPEPEPLEYQGQMIYAPAEPQPAKKKGGFVTGLVEKYGKKKLAIIGGAAAGALVLVVGIVVAAALLSGGGGKIKSRSKTGFMFQTDYKVTGASFDYMIAKENVSDSDAHYGVLDYDGNQVLPFVYDEMEFVDVDRYPDLFMVKKDGLCGLIKADGTEVIRAKYDAVGYCERYDTLYVIDAGKGAFLLYDTEGNKKGRVKYGSGNTLTVPDDIAYHTIWGNAIEWKQSSSCEEITVYGMTGPDVMLIKNDGKLKFVSISESEVLNEYKDKGYEITLYVDSQRKDGCYYEFSYTTSELVQEPGKLLPYHKIYRKIFLTDSHGNKTDRVIVKNQDGEEIASFRYDEADDFNDNVDPGLYDDNEYAFVDIINDNGLALVRMKEKSDYLYELIDLKTNTIIDGGDNFENFNHGNFVVLHKDEKEEDDDNDDGGDGQERWSASIYNRDGRKLYERGHLAKDWPRENGECCLFYDYLNKRYLLNNGVLLHKRTNDDTKIVIQSFEGEEREIVPEGCMRILPIYDRIGPIYDRRNSVYLRNFLLSRRKTYGEYINQTQYYIINYEDQDAYKCVLINDNGEVISEPHAFSVEFDPENPGFTWYTQYSFATMHGICVQTDDGKVWWYNRNA